MELSIGRATGRLMDMRKTRIWEMLPGLLFSVLVVCTTIISYFSFAHGSRGWYWNVPPDIWGTLRDAVVILHGNIGHLYAANTALVSFPGTPILLLPVAFLVIVLHLNGPAPLGPHVILAHPSADFVLAPYAGLLAAIPVLVADHLARRLEVDMPKRLIVSLVVAGSSYLTVASWGHPEDIVAVALLMLSIAAVADGRLGSSGWWLGAAIAVQPLVLLAVPMLLGAIFAQGGRSGLIRFCIQAGLPSIVLLAVPLIDAPRITVLYLMKQPNFPLVDHVTPFTTFAPYLGGKGKGMAVAAGPSRLFALVLSVGGIPLGWRWRNDLGKLIAVASMCLALRVVFESVMDPYYICPALMLAGLALASGDRRLLLAGAVVSVFLLAIADIHGWPWLLWWMIVVGGTVLVSALAVVSTHVWKWTDNASVSTAAQELRMGAS